MLLRRLCLLAVCASSAAFAPSSVGLFKASAKLPLGSASRVMSARSAQGLRMQHGDEHDILLRAARGEETNRSPVWLMRQAGRYMKDFRAYSDKYSFRKRSETSEIAIELSLQPFKAFGTDGVIMFSDILTPLPGMGIDFAVVKGKGPVIWDPIRSMDMVKDLKPIDDPDASTPFIREILGSLRKETEGSATLLGFIGSPFTLAAYSVEGKANKNCFQTKKMMNNDPEIMHAFLEHITENIAAYACHQIECGAQVLQIFESWAHHLGPDDFSVFAKPYADRVVQLIKAKHPETPLIYFANGGSSYLERQKDMKADMICVDWKVDMAVARQTLGADVRVSGNVDPLVLLGPESKIREAVRDCVSKAGPGHVLNLGHGVIQETPEEAVGIFVDEAKKFQYSDIGSHQESQDKVLTGV